MTVEEIEILVTAKVEEALKEFQKILPVTKQVMKQAQEAFSKVNMKEFQKAIDKSLTLVRKQLRELKRSSENNKIKIKVTNADAMKQIRQVKKELESLHEQQNSRRHKN